ncbi:MAG: PQQ-binding-like beta-propeller repeat protein [Bacillota bacterium]
MLQRLRRPARLLAAGTALALLFVMGFGSILAPGPGLFRPRTALAADDFTFVTITDPHAGSSAGNTNMPKVVDQVLANNPRPAFIINGGDVTEFGLPHHYDLYQQMIKPWRDANIPVYHVPGNHDARWSDAGKMGFTARFGQPYSSFDQGGIHFVLLDTSISAETHGHLEKAMLDWLAADLKKVGTSTPVMVFSHHPIGYTPSRFLDNDQDFLDIVQPYNVVALFSGHGHTNLQWSVNGIPAFMTAAVMDAGFKVIQVEGGEARIYNQVAGAQPELAATIPLTRPTQRQLLRITSPVTGTTVKGPATQTLSFKYQLTGFVEQAPDKAQYRLDAGSWQNLDVPVAYGAEGTYNGTGSIDLKGLPPGIHDLYVQAYDPAGKRYVDHVEIRLDGYLRPAGSDGAAGGTNGAVSDGPLFDSVPTLRWRFATGGGIQGQPATDGSLVYVGSSDGRLYAVRADKGTQAWVFSTGGAIISGPTLANGRLYFGSANGRVYALDAANGRLVWSRATQGSVVGAPLVVGDTVYIGSTDHNLYALKASDGSERWHFTAGDAIRVKPAYGRGLVYVGAWDRNLYALDAVTGRVRWTQALGRDIYYSPSNGSPIYGFGRLFVTTPQDAKTGSIGLRALNPDDGTALWTSSLGTSFSSPQLRAGSLLVGTSDGSALTLDPLTGQIQGKASSGWSTYDSSPVDFGQGGDVVVGSLSGRLVSENPTTGQVLWTYALGDNFIFGTPTAAPTPSTAGSGFAGTYTAYVGSMDGYLYAVAARPSPALPQPSFSDTATNWARTDIQAIAAANMVNGLPDGRFGVDLPLLKGELAAMVARYLALTQPSVNFSSRISDLNGHWSKPYVEALEEKGLLAGLVDEAEGQLVNIDPTSLPPDQAGQPGAGQILVSPFHPQDPITRGEAAQLIAAALRLSAPSAGFHSNLTDLGSYAGRSAVQALEEKGLVTGYVEGGRMIYNPSGSLTRAQGAALVARMLRY